MRTDPHLEVAALVDAMRRRGIPIETVDVQGGAYDRKLILVRTDQHVVWRGDALPDRPEILIDTLRGKVRGAANRAAA